MAAAVGDVIEALNLLESGPPRQLPEWTKGPREEQHRAVQLLGVPVVGQVPRVAAAVLVAGLVAGCTHTGVASLHLGLPSHTGRRAAPQREYVVCTQAFCTGPGQMKVRPTVITASGDGSLYVTAITWRGWGTGDAAGTGTAHADNCKPNCAQGTFREDPATITLTGPKLWRDDMAYSRETISVPAIHDQVTFSRGLVPVLGPSSQPVSGTDA